MNEQYANGETYPATETMEARYKAKEIMQHGRITALVTAMEEAAASLKSGMALGALETLRSALHHDKSFYTTSPVKR